MPPSETFPSSADNSEALARKIKMLASQGAFAEADALREELLRSAPTAISLIVSTGEFIEEEKTKHLDGDHLALWRDLYDSLSEEEANNLFYRLKEDRIPAGKILFLQGKPNNRLFFVEEGGVTLFYRTAEQNISITPVERGSMLGGETFFGISFCTFSAATQSTVHLRHLSRNDTADWPEHQPGLYNKLSDFYRKTGKAEQAFSQKVLERRSLSRFPMEAVATAVILDRLGNRTVSYFKGAVADLSRTGICFSMKCSRQETARALLGRQLELSLALPGQDDRTFRSRGTIVKVSFLLHNDYHVHVKLAETIDEGEFKQFPCDWSAATDRKKR